MPGSYHSAPLGIHPKVGRLRLKVPALNRPRLVGLLLSGEVVWKTGASYGSRSLTPRDPGA
jgi:hypothetical protein